MSSNPKWITYTSVLHSTEPELLLPHLVNRCKAKTIYPVIAMLYFTAKFDERVNRTKFKDQTEEKKDDAVNLLNTVKSSA